MRIYYAHPISDYGTTHEQVLLRWDEDQFAMQPVNQRPPYPYMDDEQRKVARDAYVSWRGSRYSVPWQYAGKEVWVRDHGRGKSKRQRGVKPRGISAAHFRLAVEG